MRLGKPWEHLQNAMSAAQRTDVPMAEAVTTMGRQVAYFGYLTNDMFVWANNIKFYNLKPSTAARVNKHANRFWLAGILLSITFGLLKVGRLANEAKQLQSPAWSEKGAEVEREAKLQAIKGARADIRYQFIVDLLDVWIPATNLGLVNLNDGIVGMFGFISSLMTLRQQWLAVNGKK